MSPTVPGVALPWLFFGHSNHVYTEDAPLSVRFTRRADSLVCSKTMFLCSQVDAHPHAHYPRYVQLPNNGSQYIAIGTDPDHFRLPTSELHQSMIRPQHLLPVESAQAMVYHFFNKVLWWRHWRVVEKSILIRQHHSTTCTAAAFAPPLPGPLSSGPHPHQHHD